MRHKRGRQILPKKAYVPMTERFDNLMPFAIVVIFEISLRYASENATLQS